MHTGWIKLYRCLLADPIWQCGTSEQKVVLVTLLLMANHAEKKWQWRGRAYLCRPGQMITSLKSIQKKCGKGISIKVIRTALKRFEKLGFLANESTMQNRLITICHWERYQSSDAPQGNASDNQQADDGQPPGKPWATNKNIKKVKNEKKGRPSSFSSLSFEQQDIQRAKATNTQAMAAFMED